MSVLLDLLRQIRQDLAAQQGAGSYAQLALYGSAAGAWREA